MIQAVTNRQVGLKYVFSIRFEDRYAHRDGSVISELVVGYMLPGKPIAMMMCVASPLAIQLVLISFYSRFKVILSVILIWIDH